MSVLVEAGVASEQDVQLALVEGAGSGQRLGEVLVRRGVVTEEHLGRLLAQQWSLPFFTDDDLGAARPLTTILGRRRRESQGLPDHAGGRETRCCDGGAD